MQLLLHSGALCWNDRSRRKVEEALLEARAVFYASGKSLLERSADAMEVLERSGRFGAGLGSEGMELGHEAGGGAPSGVISPSGSDGEDWPGVSEETDAVCALPGSTRMPGASSRRLKYELDAGVSYFVVTGHGASGAMENREESRGESGEEVYGTINGLHHSFALSPPSQTPSGKRLGCTFACVDCATPGACALRWAARTRRSCFLCGDNAERELAAVGGSSIAEERERMALAELGLGPLSGRFEERAESLRSGAPSLWPQDTLGLLAIDSRRGAVVACASTGCSRRKTPGRVSPCVIPGLGLWAGLRDGGGWVEPLRGNRGAREGGTTAQQWRSLSFPACPDPAPRGGPRAASLDGFLTTGFGDGLLRGDTSEVNTVSMRARYGPPKLPGMSVLRSTETNYHISDH